MVDTSGRAFAPGAMRYIGAQTVDNIPYNYFICKENMDFYVCRIAYSDLGGTKQAANQIVCYHLFTIDTMNAVFADTDGKGTEGTIAQLQNWSNQGFYYNGTEKSIYVPLFNPDNVNQSVILVYDISPYVSVNNLSAQIADGANYTALLFPSMLTFNVIGPQKFEIESVGFATGSAESESPLYFNTNSVTSKEGIWSFKYKCDSESAYIKKSVLVNDDQSTKVYYSVRYEPNGGRQDTSVYYKCFMTPTNHVRGISAQLRKNTFVKEGYTFIGWYLSRKSDGKCLYQITENGKSTVAWYVNGSQPNGAQLALYKDCKKVQQLTSMQGDIITCTAQWQPSK